MAQRQHFMTANESLVGRGALAISADAVRLDAAAIARQVAGGALEITMTGTGIDQTATVQTKATGLTLCIIGKRVSRDGREWPWASVQGGSYSRDAWEMWMTARAAQVTAAAEATEAEAAEYGRLRTMQNRAAAEHNAAHRAGTARQAAYDFVNNCRSFCTVEEIAVLVAEQKTKLAAIDARFEADMAAAKGGTN